MQDYGWPPDSGQTVKRVASLYPHMADPQYRDEGWLREQYHEKGLSQQQIAERCDVSAVTISNWMDKHGIEVTHFRDTARFETRPDGYEHWETRIDDRNHRVYVHQLLAIAEGVAEPSELFGGPKQIHHRNGIPWANWPENIQVMEPHTHTTEHQDQRWGNSPWRDPEAMREGLSEYTQSALADVWGCSQRTIHHWRKRHGIGSDVAGRKPDRIEKPDLNDG